MNQIELAQRIQSLTDKPIRNTIEGDEKVRDLLVAGRQLAKLVLEASEGPCGAPLILKRAIGRKVVPTVHAVCELPAGHESKAHRNGNTTWTDQQVNIERWER